MFLFIYLTLLGQNIPYSPLEINNLKTQSSNIGSIEQIHFEENAVSFSSGIYLCGKDGDSVWGNGIFPSVIGMSDYYPGNVGSDPSDIKNKIYVVESNDIDFGSSWQNWKDAVELGALYYDGNNDGLYDPIDLNENGIWDENEDKPDIIGDYTAWCVYNDSKPSAERLYNNVDPKGIEIRQTIFAYDLSHTESLSNTIFIRYIIKNRGTVSEGYDSVYFCTISDPDIGADYDQDYVGCDTILNSIFAYKKDKDAEHGYGDNPPVIVNSLHQGPHSFIPGETFIDNNENGVYDEGIDTAIDTAIIHRGDLLEIEYIPGAKNLNVTSATALLKSHPSMDTPNNEIELKNYSIGGRYASGKPIVVSEFNIGNGAELGDEANLIRPELIFSGDPVTDDGWLAITAWDYRMMLSTGPFDLNEGEEVEIICSYNVGRGDSALHSITKAREITQDIIDIYNRNFTNIPVGVIQKSSITEKFSLNQNYPNPFNPSTTITYQLPKEGLVNLVVYNSIGQNVTTLVNQHQATGKYSVQFNAANLPSGVYIYKLQAGEFNSVKKMLLMK